MMANKETSLLDDFIERAENVVMGDYGELLKDIAEFTTNNILSGIERNKIITVLANNKELSAGKILIEKALTKEERHLKPQHNSKGIEGGHGVYELRMDGVYKLTEHDGIRICSRLEVVAMTRTEAGNGWGRMLEWTDIDGRLHRWAIPANLTAGDGNEAIKVLLERGLYIRAGNSKHVLDYLMSVQPENRLFSTDKTGWHNDAFITPENIYGSDNYVFQPANAVTAAISRQGTLDDWRDNVSQKAIGNSRLIHAISTAFAGSLLQAANVDSGGFHYYGNSSDGKSTAQFVAASVWGDPNAYAQTWRATANGLESIAAVHNDGTLILDEIGQANPKEIGETAYMLANGRGKSRMTKNITNRDIMTWRLLFLSSGEYTLAGMMQGEGKRTFAGQEIRIANIESNAGAGMGLFENIHDAQSPAHFADTLKHSIHQHYGTAGDAWLNAITHDTGWRGSIHTAINKLSDQLSENTSRQARRVARRFALVAYAGELATQAGITGWQKGEAITAITTCFHSWLADFGTGNREEHQILKQVRSFIEANPARFQEVPDRTQRAVIRRAGFRKLKKVVLPEGGVDYQPMPGVYVLTGQLEELAPGYDHTQIKEALHHAGWIESTVAEKKTIAGENGRFFNVVMTDV